MTAHSEITGTRVLIAPLHLRGYLGGKVPHGIRRERYEWACDAIKAGHHRREIADALGLPLSMVHNLMRRGRDQDEARGTTHRRGRGPAPGPYVWRGMTYLGQRAVAEAAGVTVRTITEHLASYGDLSRLGAENPRRSIPVEVGPYRFPSSAALAARVGVHRGTLRRWIKAGRTDAILAAIAETEARA